MARRTEIYDVEYTIRLGLDVSAEEAERLRKRAFQAGLLEREVAGGRHFYRVPGSDREARERELEEVNDVSVSSSDARFAAAADALSAMHAVHDETLAMMSGLPVTRLGLAMLLVQCYGEDFLIAARERGLLGIHLSGAAVAKRRDVAGRCWDIRSTCGGIGGEDYDCGRG